MNFVGFALLLLIALPMAAVAQVVPETPPVPPPAADASPPPDPGNGRVVGGDPAPPGSAPWQVQIFSTVPYTEADLATDDQRIAMNADAGDHVRNRQPWERTHRCGGSYIGDGWVLTAAHCVVYPGLDFLKARKVRMGTRTISGNRGQVFAIDRAAVHKNYVGGGTFPNDIAIFRIVRPRGGPRFDAKLIAPVDLPGPDAAPLADYDGLRVTGWGMLQAMGGGRNIMALNNTVNTNSPVLMQLALKALPGSRCDVLGQGVDPAKIVCAGVVDAARNLPGGKDACRGDSGGPLTRDPDTPGGPRLLVGIVSSGRGCALPGYPKIYTRVSFFREWIERAKAVPVGKVTRVE